MAKKKYPSSPADVGKNLFGNLKNIFGQGAGRFGSGSDMGSDFKTSIRHAFLVLVAIAFIGYTLFVGVVMFFVITLTVINSSAFVTPRARSSSGGVFDPGGGFADPTSCPIVGGTVSWGSYTPPLESPQGVAPEDANPLAGHGSNDYWSGLNTCGYGIPQSTGCCGPAGFTENVCNATTYWHRACDPGSSSTCDFYGYAADIRATTDTPVVLPKVDGQDAYWNCRYGFANDSGAAGHTIYCDTTDGRVHLVFTHVNEASSYPSNVVSGTIVTTIDYADNPHLHLEAQIDGSWVRPENNFCNTL